MKRCRIQLPDDESLYMNITILIALNDFPFRSLRLSLAITYNFESFKDKQRQNIDETKAQKPKTQDYNF